MDEPDELEEIIRKRGVDYWRLIIQMMNLVSIVLFLFSLSAEGNLEKIIMIGISALIAWGALVLSIRYRTKARNPIGALVSLIVSLTVAIVMTIVFFYQYMAVGGFAGLS